MDASNHYEAAFRAYLHENGFAYVAVDESRRSLLGECPVKSLDFIVHGDGGARLLVDVKGRRFPTGAEGRRRKVWECWSTSDDIRGLERWEEAFGPGYRGVLAFVYQLLPDVPLLSDTDDLWHWNGRRYLLRAITVADYRRHMRVRSPKWDTVTLPRAAYRELVQPFRHFVAGPPALVEELSV
jgi:hypothetical protein